MKNWTWRKPITWPMNWRTLGLLFGAMYLPLGYALYGWGVAPAAPEEAPRTSINYYETQCQTDAREAYGVPLLNDARVQWQLDHRHTAEGTAYNKAALACPQPAKWDFGHMILVGSE